MYPDFFWLAASEPLRVEGSRLFTKTRYFQSVDLGGLSFLELTKRTARASWRDAVFGQGSRMAFYHFLAIFPALLLLLALAARLPGMGAESKDAILNLSRQVLPRDASLLFQDTLNELNQQALSPVQIVPAFFGALWAAFNGMWAIVIGLNTAYELQERIVWAEVIRLLEDPPLIQQELDRRLVAARASDPTRKREQSLQRELTHVGKGVERLLNAYQEGLLSIEQLRERMPGLRQRQQALSAELQAIADQTNDRAAFLRLAETLSAFLVRLRSAAETLSVIERQKIVRLLVKDVLVGEDAITIRHSIVPWA